MDGAAADRSSPTPDVAERALVARIRAGDEAAFETVFLTHYEEMCALAYTLVRSRDAAEDIVSNVFRSLWKRRREWAPVGPVRTCLLSATRNEALNLVGGSSGNVRWRRSYCGRACWQSTTRSRRRRMT